MGVDFLAGLDPRVKLTAFLTVQALLFIPSAQPAPERLLAVAAPLLMLLPGARRSWRLWLRLAALAAPFLAFLSLSVWLLPAPGRPGARLVLVPLIAKSLLVLLALALFVLNEEPWRLLQALRQVGAPRTALTVMAIGLRFAGQWRSELQAICHAWTGRNFNVLTKWRRAQLLGGALPLFFERLLDGAAHVHDAMVSRGFRGELPAAWKRLVFSWRDARFVVMVALAAAAIVCL